MENALGSVSHEVVTEADAGMRLDRWFKNHFPGVKHSALEKLLRTGQVRVDGGRAKSNRRLALGEKIRIPPAVSSPPGGAGAAPKKRNATASMSKSRARDFFRKHMIFEDDDLLVISKPAGLAVQGGSRTTRHVDGIASAFANSESEKYRLTHRLDRDTAGVLVLAKSRSAAAKLGSLFQGRQIEKTYLAVVTPPPVTQTGTIDMKVSPVMVRSDGRLIEKMQAGEESAAK
ncbi:MAG: RluA family pseudouridine synthase, partial [Pseudomonadota bacterium]